MNHHLTNDLNNTFNNVNIILTLFLLSVLMSDVKNDPSCSSDECNSNTSIELHAAGYSHLESTTVWRI